MPVVNRVRAERERCGLTQVALAEAVGVARQSIISIKKARFLPTIETALRLADALGVRVDDLFSLEEARR